jgi:hypothetical protein
VSALDTFDRAAEVVWTGEPVRLPAERLRRVIGLVDVLVPGPCSLRPSALAAMALTPSATGSTP